MGHSSICLLFLPELENSEEKTTHIFKNHFLEICHRGEMQWVEGIQCVHMRGSQKRKKWNIKAQEGTQSMGTQQRS